MRKKVWYAVLQDHEDSDWGSGSGDFEKAKKKLEETREHHPDAFIAVIEDGDDPVRIAEIY